MSKILTNELVGVKESVQDEILLLNSYQTPMLSMLGISDAATAIEHVWFEDEMFTQESTVTADAAVDATSLVVADVEPFRADQVVKVGDELVLVTAVNTSTKTLTVVRGHANTIPAAITTGAVIEVQFVEGEEGRDARSARYKPRTRKSNLMQIFDDTVSITGSAAAVKNYGIDDLYEYEKQKKQLELALQLEKAIINGIKYENGVIRQMDGIKNMIKTNVHDNNGAPIDIDVINDQLQAIFGFGGFNGGGNYEIVVPARQKRAIGKFDSSLLNVNREDKGRGTVVNYLTTDFGEFPVSINDNLAADEILIIDKGRVKVRPLQGREFFHEYLGKQGDYYAGMLVGEYTLEFEQEKAHARIKGLM